MKRTLIGQISAIALASTLAAGAVAQTYGHASRTMVAGGTLLLAHYASINPDCSSRGPVAVRVMSGPSSGSVSVKQGFGYSRFSNDFQHCNARKVFGADASYTPQRGFVGVDSVQLDIIYPSGSERVETFAITVK